MFTHRRRVDTTPFCPGVRAGSTANQEPGRTGHAGQFRDDGAIRMMVAPLHRRPAEDLGPDNAVVVVAAVVEQQAPEAFRRPRARGVERVVDGLDRGARVVDLRCPAVSEHDLRVLVERVDAALKQVASVQVVVRRPLEQLTPRLLGDEVVVGETPMFRGWRK